MAVIKTPETKVPVVAWHIGSKFEKNAPFEAGINHQYLVIQNGKVLGATTGTVSKGRKSSTATLSKKHFKELKCGLFSKTVKAEIYSLRDGFFLESHVTRFREYFPKGEATTLTVEAKFSAYLLVDDAKKVYETLLKKTGDEFYTYNGISHVFHDLAIEAMNRVAKKGAVPAGTYYVNEARKNDPEIKALMEAFSKEIIPMFKQMGYKLSVSPAK